MEKYKQYLTFRNVVCAISFVIMVSFTIRAISGSNSTTINAVKNYVLEDGVPKFGKLAKAAMKGVKYKSGVAASGDTFYIVNVTGKMNGHKVLIQFGVDEDKEEAKLNAIAVDGEELSYYEYLEFLVAFGIAAGVNGLSFD